jgi:phosphoglycolate phosphatase
MVRPKQGGFMLDAVIFDKDGTLFDFRASWGGWTIRLIDSLVALGASGPALEEALGFDLRTKQFAADSLVIAATTPEIALRIWPLVGGMPLQTLQDLLNELARTAPMEPAVPLRPVLQALKDRGLTLGLATNDTEVPARAHLQGAGVLDLFSFVAGCDSGWGGKPAAGQLLAFCAAVGVPANRSAMVGDSRHDLEAGGRAGMARVAVLTGIATEAELAPHADVVLQDISLLGAWIDAKRRA